MIKEDLERVLSVLGTEGALDVLLAVRARGWTTASELAEELDIHVATAVKRLSALHDIGILESRVRRGRTRSAQEYSLRANSFGIDIDLDELAGLGGGPADAGLLLEFLGDMARRFAKFSGRSQEDVVISWQDRLEDRHGILKSKFDGTYKADQVLDIARAVVELEALEFGRLTVRSVVIASLEAVGLPQNEADDIQKLLEAI